MEEEKQQSYTQIIKDLKSDFSKLKNKLDKKEDNEVRNKYDDLLSDQFSKGIIDENGFFFSKKRMKSLLKIIADLSLVLKFNLNKGSL